MRTCTHIYTHTDMSSLPPCYYFSNSEGCDRKLCKNNEQYASVFVPIIAYPYLFPSLLSIHCARRYQWSTKCVYTQPACKSLEAWKMFKNRAGFYHWSLMDRLETFQTGDVLPLINQDVVSAVEFFRFHFLAHEHHKLSFIHLYIG